MKIGTVISNKDKNIIIFFFKLKFLQILKTECMYIVMTDECIHVFMNVAISQDQLTTLIERNLYI